MIMCISLSLTQLHAETTKILHVSIDEAKILRLDQQASSVIIGNPGIADISVYDDSTLVLTGKSYGLTNMIILDEDGKQLLRTDISVRQRDMGAITIYNADKKYSYRCMPRCEPEMNISDVPEAYSNLLSGIKSRDNVASNVRTNDQSSEDDKTNK